MNIEDQVCTFDQAALIYSHGIRLDTIWWWWENKETKKRCVINVDKYLPGKNWVKVFPSPTVAELGVLFGKKYKNVSIRIDTDIKESSYVLTFREGFIKTGLGDHHMSFHKTEAHARAEALIWFIENGHLKAENLKP